MDGRGRCHDNIFVERLWWTVKHEWVYLRPALNDIEQKRSLVQFSVTLADILHGIAGRPGFTGAAGRRRQPLPAGERSGYPASGGSAHGDANRACDRQ
jgi:hypothetical protein